MTTSPDQLRKAAILVASLDSASADRVLDEMDEVQARLVREAVVALGDPNADEQQTVIEEFFRNDPNSATKDLGGVELDEGLSQRLGISSPAPKDERDEAPQEESTAPFQFLHQAHSDKLVPHLAQEHPQTIALILAHIPPERAAEMLGSLPAELQAEVVRRLVDQREVNPEIVREVERGLMSRLGNEALSHHQRKSGIDGVLEILRSGRKVQSQAILNNLAQHGVDLGQHAGPAQFTFDDLHQLDSDSLAALVHAADKKLLALALLDRPQSLVDRVTSHMTPTAAHDLRMSHRQPGPVRLRDVEAAQQQLVELATRLTVEGRARWPQEHLLIDA